MNNWCLSLLLEYNLYRGKDLGFTHQCILSIYNIMFLLQFLDFVFLRNGDAQNRFFRKMKPLILQTTLVGHCTGGRRWGVWSGHYLAEKHVPWLRGETWLCVVSECYWFIHHPFNLPRTEGTTLFCLPSVTCRLVWMPFTHYPTTGLEVLSAQKLVLSLFLLPTLSLIPVEIQ